MYEPFTEHKFNPILPKHTAKTAQDVRKARRSFAWIPRLNKKLFLLRFLTKIIKPQTLCCCAFGTFALEGLKLLATYKLFSIFESILDAPMTRKSTDDLGRSETQIRSKEKIVFLISNWVSTDHQKHRFLRDSVPYNFSDKRKTFFVLSPFACLNPLPVGYSFRQFFWRWKLSASLLFSFLWQQIVNTRVPTYTRVYMSVGYVLTGQRGVKTIRMVDKSPLRQPQSNFCEHLFGQFYKSWAIFAVQSHIDWQAQRFSASRRVYSQRNAQHALRQNYYVQSLGVD